MSMIEKSQPAPEGTALEFERVIAATSDGEMVFVIDDTRVVVVDGETVLQGRCTQTKHTFAAFEALLVKFGEPSRQSLLARIADAERQSGRKFGPLPFPHRWVVKLHTNGSCNISIFARKSGAGMA